MSRLIKRSTLTISRDDGGGYYDAQGRWVEGTRSAFDIQCNIQPFKSGDEQDILPEGISTKDAVVVRSTTQLKTSEQVQDKEKADTTTLDGLEYVAFFTENWNRYNLQTDHFKTTFIRKDQMTGGSL